MATLLTTVKLNRIAVAASKNKLVLSSRIDWSLSDKFETKDDPIGDSINIPRPVLANVVQNNMAFTSGAGEVVQTYSTLIVNATATAFLAFSEFNLAMQGSPEDVLRRFSQSIAPQMASVADSILYDALVNAGSSLKSTAFNGGGQPILGSSTVQSATNPGAQWVVYGSGVTAGVATPSQTYPGALLPADVFKIQAILDDSACPEDERYGILTPSARAFLGDAASKYFNPQVDASKAFRSGYIGSVSGIEWSSSQVTGIHTNGLWAGTPKIDTTAVTGQSTWTESMSITVAGNTGGTTMRAGDMIEIGGVAAGTGIFWVNPLTKLNTGRKVQFTVQTAVASATASQALVVSPAIITSGPYQNAVIVGNASENVTLLGDKGATYQESIVFQKEAIKGANPKLWVDPTDKSASYQRDEDSKIGIRLMSTFDKFGAAAGLNGNPKRLSRFDLIFGVKVFRPEWCVRVRTAVIG